MWLGDVRFLVAWARNASDQVGGGARALVSPPTFLGEAFILNHNAPFS